MNTKKAIPVLMLMALVVFGFEWMTDDCSKTIPSKSTTEVAAVPKVGDIAPELAFESPNGEIIKLSSLKGQMVLIDFWASWCGPCRRENPNVVKAYNHFKDKKFKNGDGFTVYSVSLDNNKAAWERAIKADNLTWKYHVSDLKGWQAAGAALYGVRGIPASFLVDGNGKIIATNLRGKKLDKFLESQLK